MNRPAPNAIEAFLRSATFAVAGASADPNKYGHIVFRALLASGRSVVPLNPKGILIEGVASFPDLRAMDWVPEAVSIVTPPQATRTVVDAAIALGVKRLWMQPGAEDAVACQRAREAGLELIDDGSCILVALAREKRPAS